VPARGGRTGGGAADRTERSLRLDCGRTHRLSLVGRGRAPSLPDLRHATRLRDEPDYLDVTLASLDDPEAVRPSYHSWTASRIAWFDTADDLPRYGDNRRPGFC
jgi:hypothetical protein